MTYTYDDFVAEAKSSGICPNPTCRLRIWLDQPVGGTTGQVPGVGWDVTEIVCHEEPHCDAFKATVP